MERQDQLRFRSYRLIFRILAAFVSDNNQCSWARQRAAALMGENQRLPARPASSLQRLKHATCHADPRKLNGVHRSEGGKRLLSLGNHSPAKFISAAPRPTIFSKPNRARSYGREESPIGSLIVKVVPLPSSD